VLLLIDENVPESVASFFRDRGHDVRFVRDLLLPGTPDAVVAALGDELAAVIVTWNHRDFKRLAARVPEGNVQRFRRLGRINFRCNEAHGRRRAEDFIEEIEFHYAQAQKRRDTRLMIEITATGFRIVR
jgi:predicted nuclease of predicted toxin-antitoxin system